MRAYSFVLAAIVAGCGGNGSTTVTPSSTPPSDNGGGGGGGNGGGGAGSGGMPGGGGGMPGGGGGGMPGGGGGGTGGGGAGGGGGGCSETTPVAIASAGSEALTVAVDDTDVYFTARRPDQTAGAWRAPRNGGVAVDIIGPDHSAGQLTVNATAFFTTENGRILRWAKSGGAPTVLATIDSEHYSLGCLADALGYIYFCAGEASHYYWSRVPEDGGTAQLFAMTLGPEGIAFDPQHVFLTGNGGLAWTAPDGSGPRSYIQGILSAFAVDDLHVFFAGTGVLRVADKRDGATPSDFAPTFGDGRKLITRDGSIYVLSAQFDMSTWTTTHSQIARFAADSGASTVLVDRAGDITDMTVRGDYVYFTFGNAVYRVCR